MMISVAAPQLASVIPVAPGGSSTRPSLTRRAAETVMKNMKKHMCAADVHQSAERCRNMQKLFLDLDLRSCPKINHTESGIPDI
jgi:tyrosine-protein phosphatase YwqE